MATPFAKTSLCAALVSAAACANAAETAGSVSAATAFAALAALALAAGVVCFACMRRLAKAVAERRRLESVLAALPFNFAAAKADGEFLYLHYTNPAFDGAKRLREFGAKDEKLYKRAFREISDTAAKTAKFEFESSVENGRRYEAEVRPLPENVFGEQVFLLTGVDITDRHSNQTRADILHEHEKIFRIALQMIAQNKGFDDFSNWLLENLMKWLQADRVAAYKFGGNGLSVLAECARVAGGAGIECEIGESSKFRAMLKSQNAVVYDSADPKTEESVDAILPHLKAQGVKSAVFFGAVSDGEPVGFLSAECLKNRRKFSDFDKNAVVNAAKIIQIAQDRKDSYQKLKDSMLRKRLVLQTLDFPVILLDPDGNVETSNDAAKYLAGKAPANLADLAGVADGFSELFEKAKSEKSAESKRAFIGGNVYEISCKPALDDAGNVANVVAIFSDITKIYKEGEGNIPTNIPATAIQKVEADK